METFIELQVASMCDDNDFLDSLMETSTIKSHSLSQDDHMDRDAISNAILDLNMFLQTTGHKKLSKACLCQCN